jgi:type IV pilus biogenesis protein CpaD/CtpE
MSDEAIAEQAIRITEACVVHPGDVLVLSIDRPLEQQQADRIKAHLDRYLPDTIKTVIVDNSFQLHVLRTSEQT